MRLKDGLLHLDEGGLDGFMRLKVGLLHPGEGDLAGVPRPPHLEDRYVVGVW